MYKNQNFQAIGLDHWDGSAASVRIFQQIPPGLTYPICLNASATKNIYTQPGFYNDFSILIDQAGIVRYKGAGVLVSQITNWINTLLAVPVEDADNSVPGKLHLYQNYPNPFNPITKISFNVEKQQGVDIEIFDVTGKLIRRLVDNTFYAGYHELFWDGTDNKGNLVNSGIYFYILRSGRQTITKKMTLLR